MEASGPDYILNAYLQSFRSIQRKPPLTQFGSQNGDRQKSVIFVGNTHSNLLSISPRSCGLRTSLPACTRLLLHAKEYKAFQLLIALPSPFSSSIFKLHHPAKALEMRFLSIALSACATLGLVLAQDEASRFGVATITNPTVSAGQVREFEVRLDMKSSTFLLILTGN